MSSTKSDTSEPALSEESKHGPLTSQEGSTKDVDQERQAKALETTEAQVSQTSDRSKTSITLIMLALCMAAFLAALDVAVVTTALPEISQDLHASQTAYSWIGSAYLLTYAAITPFWAKCSDIFGRKPVLLIANVVFLVGSLVCALANSAAMLIAGRAVQGAGGGGLIILVNITVSDLVSLRQVSFSTCSVVSDLYMQRARQVLWLYRDGLGDCIWNRSRHWWCSCREGLMALVLLHQSTMRRSRISCTSPLLEGAQSTHKASRRPARHRLARLDGRDRSDAYASPRLTIWWCKVSMEIRHGNMPYYFWCRGFWHLFPD